MTEPITPEARPHNGGCFDLLPYSLNGPHLPRALSGPAPASNSECALARVTKKESYVGKTQALLSQIAQRKLLAQLIQNVRE